MVNALTRKTGLTLGPIILETLVKHYFERISKDHDEEETTRLRKEELLYDEAFNIVKSFMEAATKHTVEELQAFSNTRTPSPPWVHVVRLLVPMSSCDEAATYLIKALGGEEVTKRVVGGTKWWQVRGVKGVDAEWIVAKKDWQEAKKKQKARGMSHDGAPVENGNTQQELPAQYQPEMDEMRCILYAHGGGYYFGSIDQERYSIQRLARKINGRVFTINYRLAPQYPFPCAIQDFLAAYLYLIRPPAGALHTPVSPSNIVFSGDSAGGGLCIALLQVVRDSGLPLPGGAVLISPWCDLTHSYPSIHLNTATDIIPKYGLSLHKPSTLWPPPPDDLTTRVHQGLRQRIREAVRHRTKDGKLDVPASDAEAHPASSTSRPTTPDYSIPVSTSNQTLHLGGTGSIPIPTSMEGVRSQRVSMVTQKGEELAVDRQVHMYAPNYLLTHPLVSPVVSYLGGLPPLLVIASDKEVLRDEIIYFAHKAAYPDKYPVKPEARELYPALDGIEKRYGPTKVHLQVYDDCAHTLPILFAFTTPAKYCFRAMATFIKFVTGMLPTPVVENPIIPEAPITASPASTQSNLLAKPEARNSREASTSITSRMTTPQPDATFSSSPEVPANASSPPVASGGSSTSGVDPPAPTVQHRKSMRRALSASVTRATTGLLRRNHTTTATASSSAHPRRSTGSSDVGGPRFHPHDKESKEEAKPAHRHAGESSVYNNGLDMMIRERISTHGIIRPLESETELDAFRLPPELIGELSELAVRRYVEGTTKFAKKFAKTYKSIEKARQRNIERAHQDAVRNMAQLQQYFSGATSDSGKPAHEIGVDGDIAASSSWAWAWALDEDEHPPPSSIVSRRDTEEARRLALVADQAVFMDEHALSGNNLWSLIVDFLTITPDRDADKHKHTHTHKHQHSHRHEHEHGHGEGNVDPETHEKDAEGGSITANGKGGKDHRSEKLESTSRGEKIMSRFARLMADNRKSQGAAAP
ncbi:alpha/beta-hydrolase [Lentinus tigrinus ALCF2SS1-7]|uniref:alpha/beta-hydrolase n=1 Tax=Lentinus tigrinus ALCF2SS1-7 TaxID=1328758 RepID=UPI001165EB95|nr:alpha/beta-hydrolase [Lentinus tigrinus ALCF2SS1-7]